MASKTKNKYSVSVVKRKALNTLGRYDGIIRYVPILYLSKKDIKKGAESFYSEQGFIVESL